MSTRRGARARAGACDRGWVTGAAGLALGGAGAGAGKAEAWVGCREVSGRARPAEAAAPTPGGQVENLTNYGAAP